MYTNYQVRDLCLTLDYRKTFLQLIRLQILLRTNDKTLCNIFSKLSFQNQISLDDKSSTKYRHVLLVSLQDSLKKVLNCISFFVVSSRNQSNLSPKLSSPLHISIGLLFRIASLIFLSAHCNSFHFYSNTKSQHKHFRSLKMILSKM
eukprot:NODE_226_length_13883_cov_0.528729.p11 type:complete len:147 gc:universal NODE_226_length_13883_cov_0.528729:8064-8504(+)